MCEKGIKQGERRQKLREKILKLSERETKLREKGARLREKDRNGIALHKKQLRNNLANLSTSQRKCRYKRVNAQIILSIFEETTSIAQTTTRKTPRNYQVLHKK